MFTIDTFGPFSLHSPNGKLDKASFWSEVKDAQEDLCDAFGIYIFAVERPDESLYPCYIGKTTASFRKRLDSHLRKQKILTRIRKAYPKDRVKVLLLAFTTPKRGGAAKTTVSRKQWLDFLETAMIGACLAKNKDIQNDKKTVLYKKVCVPGYLGDNPNKRDKSAVALAKLLQVSYDV